MHYNGILYTFQTPFQIKYIIFYGPSITHKNYYFCTLRCFVLFQRSLCLKFGRIGQLELKSSCRNHFVYITYEWRRRQIHNITWLQNYFCGACTNFVYYPTQRDILEISEIEKNINISTHENCLWSEKIKVFITPLRDILEISHAYKNIDLSIHAWLWYYQVSLNGHNSSEVYIWNMNRTKPPSLIIWMFLTRRVLKQNIICKASLK